MNYRGVFIALVTLLVLMIGGMLAVGWYITRETPERFGYEDAAVWAPDYGTQMELLDADIDGSMLIAFYEGGLRVHYDDLTGQDVVEIAEQQPGILVVTPGGQEHVLREPEPLEDNAVGSAVGSIYRGSIAVSWQVQEGGVRADGTRDYVSPSPTVAMATGTAAGLTPMPAPTVDGSPVGVQWGGLHVADGALVALVRTDATSLGEAFMAGIVDPATGAFTAVDQGTLLAPMRDQCDQTGSTFGYVATGASGGGLEVHQFSVTQGCASSVENVTLPSAIADTVPISACASDSAGVETGSGTLLWTDGPDNLSRSTVGHPAGDVFLSPDWVAVYEIDLTSDYKRIVVVDRKTRIPHDVGATCQRLVAAGDWIAFGYADGDKCTPVAVPVSAILSPS